MRLSSFCTLATAATLCSAPAMAATVDALSLIQSYNAIALEDFTMSSSHVEGTMYVGGDLNFQNDTDVNGDGQVPSVLGGALVVGGDVIGPAPSSEMRVLNGDASIGGSANGHVKMNGGGTLTEGASVPTTDVAEAMIGLSALLASLDATVGASYDNSDPNAPITLGSGNADGYAVLDLNETDGASFLAGNLNTLDTTGFAGVFINIAGASLTHTGNWNAQANNVILNFYEATTFGHTNGNLNYSVLAPLADVTNGGSGMNGFLVGKTITNSAEIRPPFGTDALNYTGTLPVVETAPVPLPAAGFMLIGALGALAFARRQRRAV